MSLEDKYNHTAGKGITRAENKSAEELNDVVLQIGGRLGQAIEVIWAIEEFYLDDAILDLTLPMESNAEGKDARTAHVANVTLEGPHDSWLLITTHVHMMSENSVSTGNIEVISMDTMGRKTHP